jgi:hypothetical protein
MTATILVGFDGELLDAQRPRDGLSRQLSNHGPLRSGFVQSPAQFGGRVGHQPQGRASITAVWCSQLGFSDRGAQCSGHRDARIEASILLLQMPRLSGHLQPHSDSCSGTRNGSKPLSAMALFRVNSLDGDWVRGWTTTQVGLVTAASFRT